MQRMPGHFIYHASADMDQPSYTARREDGGSTLGKNEIPIFI
jgi:hypothetical protein